MENLEAYINEAIDLLGDGQPPESYAKAHEMIKKLEAEGDGVVNLLYGIAYYFGRGVEENNELAAEYFSKAADDGYVGAYYLLGQCYYYAYGVEQDKTEAYGLYRMAAEAGFREAAEDLHNKLAFTGEEKEPWENEALENEKVTDENVEEYLQRAEAGSDICAYLLAKYYCDKKEFNTAKKWGRIAQASKLYCASTIMWWIEYDIKSIETDKIDEIYRELKKNGIPKTDDGHEPNAVLVSTGGELTPIYIESFETSETLGAPIGCDRIDIISSARMRKLSDMILETVVGYCDRRGYEKNLFPNSAMQNLSGYPSILGNCVICGYDKDYIPLNSDCAVALSRWYNEGGRVKD